MFQPDLDFRQSLSLQMFPADLECPEILAILVFRVHQENQMCLECLIFQECRLVQ